MNSETKEWVAVVYDGCDKIGSHIFHSETEAEAYPPAEKWVKDNHGIGRDWSLHRIHSDSK